MLQRYVALVPSRMEDTMCWDMDYRLWAEQKKAEETRIKQQQRAGVIDQLLNEATKQGEKTNAAAESNPEVTPAD
jgi:hypothetical protein